MSTEVIAAEELGTLNLARDGTRIFLGLIREDGREIELSLPTDCLRALIMTLPQVMRQSLRVRHHDDSLRLVYPAEHIRIEQSSNLNTLIVTLATKDGFEVSFGLTHQQLMCFNHAATNLGPLGADGNRAAFS